MSCPDCFSGQSARHGEPQGKMIKLHGLDTYVAEPADGMDGRANKGSIVIIPDAMGIEFTNNKLLADAYASKGGYKVYMPDFMRGHSCPAYLLDSMKAIMTPGNWLTKLYHIFWGAYAFIPWRYHNRISATFPVVQKFLQDFRQDQGFGEPLGVAGFCWGGKHTVLLSHADNFFAVAQNATEGGDWNDNTNSAGRKAPLLDAGFVGHPSFLDIPHDVQKIAVPIAWALAEQDHHIKVPDVTDVITKIVETDQPDETKGQVKIYHGCRHGFCVRVDVLSGDVNGFANQAIEAEDQAIEWFNDKLGANFL